MVVWPTFFSAGPPPTIQAKPLTPTKPIAMPTGTRSSISTNRTTKPRMAIVSELIALTSFHRLDRVRPGQQLGMKNQTVGAPRKQKDRRHVADPGQQEERPGGKPQIEGEHVIGARALDLVE